MRGGRGEPFDGLRVRARGRGIPFVKMSGSGNDFVLLDGRGGRFPDSRIPALTRRLCHRTEGVGADGSLVLRKEGPNTVRMIYHNADGSRARLCGNGVRCTAHFARSLGLVSPDFTLVSDAGVHSASVRGDWARVDLVPPRLLAEALPLKVGSRRFTGDLVEVGVPHLVIRVREIENFDLAVWGPPLRRHPALGPAGANVNVIQDLKGGLLRVRTFERGVEGETQACGTGSVASVWSRLGLSAQGGSLRVQTTGGDILDVRISPAPGGLRSSLGGPVRRVFEGRWKGEA